MRATTFGRGWVARLLGLSLAVAALGGALPARSAEKTAQPVRAAGPTIRLVVAAAEAPGPEWRGHWAAAGQALSEMLTTALVNRGVTVLERRGLGVIEREEGLVLDGSVDPRTAERFGRQLGAQAILYVRITEFGGSSQGGSAGALGGLGFGGLRVGKNSTRVKVDARLVEVGSTRVLAAATGSGSESKWDFGVSGGRLFSWIAGINFTSREWLESRLGRCTRKALEQIADELTPRIPAAREDARPAPAPREEAAERAGAPSAALSDLRRLTFAVLIPETHLSRPRIPDPAAETELIRRMLKLGLRVKDDQRLKELREEAWVREAARGVLSRAELEGLRARYGVDVLIVGEGISERDEQGDPDRRIVVCRGRVEIRAIRLDTAEILAADAAHAPGRDLGEALAAKAALQRAGGDLADRFVQQIADTWGRGAGAGNAGGARMELEVSGLESLSDAMALLEALGRVEGVRRAELTEWKGGTAYATLDVSPTLVRRLAVLLETDGDLRRFGLRVAEATGGRIVAVTRA